MKKKVLTDNIIKVLLFINLLSVISIPCLENFANNINIYYLILNAISFIGILIFRPKIKIGGFFIFGILYYLILSLSTLLNHGNIYQLLYEMLTCLTVLIIWNSFNKEEFKKYINIPVIMLEILAYIDLIIILLYPDGLYNQGLERKYYLFGHVNVAIRYLLPGCCLTLIRTYLNNDKIDFRCIFYFIVVALTLLITWPTTAIIGFVLFIFSIILMNIYKETKKILSPISSLSFAAIISYLIIKVRIQEYFNDFIVQHLHRDLTFTGRLEIWDNALYYISEKTLHGYGRLSETARYLYLNASSAHNEFLILLFEGGIFLLALIFLFIFLINKKLTKCNNKEVTIVLTATILSYFVMWIAEPFSYSGTILMFLIWLIAYNSPILFDNNRDRKENESK